MMITETYCLLAYNIQRTILIMILNVESQLLILDQKRSNRQMTDKH
jgi:hypothetical protein